MEQEGDYSDSQYAASVGGKMSVIHNGQRVDPENGFPPDNVYLLVFHQAGWKK